MFFKQRKTSLSLFKCTLRMFMAIAGAVLFLTSFAFDVLMLVLRCSGAFYKLLCCMAKLQSVFWCLFLPPT